VHSLDRRHLKPAVHFLYLVRGSCVLGVESSAKWRLCRGPMCNAEISLAQPIWQHTLECFGEMRGLFETLWRWPWAGIIGEGRDRWLFWGRCVPSHGGPIGCSCLGKDGVREVF
jgi:hypothetical protein